MKKYLLALLGILFIIIASGCGTGDTITDNPRNYVYGPNEVINIYDNVDTGDLIGTLRITSVNVLSEGPNYVNQMVSIDEDGNPVYEDVAYAQLIQINYVYEAVKGSSTTIGGYNFDVEDGTGHSASLNPKIAYTMLPIENVESFVVLTKNNTTVLNIEFNYEAFQFEPTAKILMRITDTEVGEPIVTAPQVETPEPAKEEPVSPILPKVQAIDNTGDFNSRLTELKKTISERDRTIESLNKTIEELNSEKGMTEDKGTKDTLIFLVACLGIIVFVLAMAIYGKHKDIENLQRQLEDKKEL